MIWRLRGRVLDLDARVRVMGILNTTPDSFFAGSRVLEPARAVERGLQMVADGAELLDVGGESTRPSMYGAVEPVSVEEECRRVVPVVEGLRRQSDIPISVDTTKAEVARRALDVGADIVNDISALRDDPGMAAVAREHEAPVVLMHRRGPQEPPYRDLVGEVRGFLADRIQAAVDAELAREQLAVDPGIGFGKNVAQNLSLVRNLEAFAALGCPLLVGASRKSFIWKTLDTGPEGALEGSLAVAVLSAERGARILRVHDVPETVRAVRVAMAVLQDCRN